MIVVSDTSPINYFCLIGHLDVLPALFGQVIVPSAVADELSHTSTPQQVRDFISNLPEWLTIQSPQSIDAALAALGAGEREAISLAKELNADLLMIDDIGARKAAQKNNLRFVGTLAVLKIAADKGMLNLSQAVQQIRNASFYVSDELLKRILS